MHTESITTLAVADARAAMALACEAQPDYTSDPFDLDLPYPDTSGEWAGSTTPTDVTRAAGLPDDCCDDDWWAAIEVYESAFIATILNGWFWCGRMYVDGPSLIESMIRSGEASPSARDMDAREVADQYVGANALDSDDDDYPARLGDIL